MPRKSPTKASKLEEAVRLKSLRTALGFTQREMAKEFLVSQGSINLWENGERTVPGAVIKLMDIYEERIKAGKARK